MSSSASSRLRGVVPAITTPFTESGGVDHPALERQVAYLRDAGAHGIFACGGTGEGAYLTVQEKADVVRTVRDVIGPDGLLCAALIGPSTAEVAEQMAALAGSAIDYVVATAPFYYAMRQQDLVEHYVRLAAVATTPLIAYNIPSATHNPMTAATMGEISGIDGVAGLKDSSGDLATFTRALLADHAEDFAWFQGEDYLCGPALVCGANGMVSGLANARVEPYVEMFAAHERGDTAAVLRAQARVNRLYEIIHLSGRGNPAIKGATALAGRGTFAMRVPGQTLDASERDAVARVLADFDRA